MNRLKVLVFILLFAAPLLAQDDDGGGGTFDVNDLFGNAEFGGPVAPRVDPLIEVRNSLLRASAPPLEKKQESPVKKVYDKELKELNKVFEKRFGVSLESAIASQTGARGGRRGAPRVSSSYATEVRRLNDLLFDKMIAALRIDQQAALRKFQSEQTRVTRLNAMTESMASAGLELTAQQKSEVEALYARESRLRTLIIVEAKGQPYQGRVSYLENETVEKVVQLLDEQQKGALAAARPASGSR